MLDDLRIYAAELVASVTRKESASEQVAETLLRPISTWPTRRGGGPVAVDGDVAIPTQTAQAE